MVNRLSLFSPNLEGGFRGFGEARFKWWLNRICDEIWRKTPYSKHCDAVKNCNRVRNLIKIWPSLKRKLKSGECTDFVIRVADWNGDVDMWFEFKVSSEDYRLANESVKKIGFIGNITGMPSLLWAMLHKTIEKKYKFFLFAPCNGYEKCGDYLTRRAYVLGAY